VRLGRAWRVDVARKTNNKVWMELKRVRMDVAWKSEGGWSSKKRRRGANEAQKSDKVWMELKRVTRLGAAQIVLPRLG